ncbi:MAG TPA: membrane bound O-acyl transferase family-domain-containing protein, partial [Caulifigura sp.]|nr:membrane bound O-acyl transferase family-domain-containing protein [Caulifigura sp.]
MIGLPNLPLPRWALMWTVAFGIYAGLKLMSWMGRSGGRASPWTHLAYLTAWPGMNANAFLFTPPADVTSPGRFEWLSAATKTVTGIVLVRVAIDLSSMCHDRLAGWIGMVGIVMSLHFGLFHLLSCLWRACGICATPIMNAPPLATSVSDFWSRRWNLAFRDLASRFVVTPLRRRLGAHGAIAAGFFLSGLIHDVVMSLPAGGGSGGPTAYFVLQYVATAAERCAAGRRIGLA